MRSHRSNCASAWRNWPDSARPGSWDGPSDPIGNGDSARSHLSYATPDQADEADLAVPEAAVHHRDGAVVSNGQLAHEQPLEAPVEAERAIRRARHDGVA